MNKAMSMAAFLVAMSLFIAAPGVMNFSILPEAEASSKARCQLFVGFSEECVDKKEQTAETCSPFGCTEENLDKEETNDRIKENKEECKEGTTVGGIPEFQCSTRD